MPELLSQAAVTSALPLLSALSVQGCIMGSCTMWRCYPADSCTSVGRTMSLADSAGPCCWAKRSCSSSGLLILRLENKADISDFSACEQAASRMAVATRSGAPRLRKSGMAACNRQVKESTVQQLACYMDTPCKHLAKLLGSC